MGLLTTRWRTTHRGHELVVTRNELTKGFELAWDGTRVARRRWSWIGHGTLRATIELDG